MPNSFATLSPVCGIEWSPNCLANFGFGKREPIVVSYSFTSRLNGESDLPITYGARLMLSTPPAMYISPSPQLMARAASTTACRPLAQSRFTVTPGVVGGRPASSAAKRAMLRLSSPACVTQPITTSLISFGSILFRETTSLITSAARSSGRTGASLPAWRPIGVRSPS